MGIMVLSFWVMQDLYHQPQAPRVWCLMRSPFTHRKSGANPEVLDPKLQVITLGLQIAQSRYYLQTLDPKVGTICILGALGLPCTISPKTPKPPRPHPAKPGNVYLKPSVRGLADSQ